MFARGLLLLTLTGIRPILGAQSLICAIGNPLHQQHQLQQPLCFSTTSASSMTRRAAAISVSHGGGPLPLLGDAGMAALAESLRTKVPKVLRLHTPEAPRALVVVTAHWETAVTTVSVGAAPPLLYDYYGFPRAAYELKYPAPGAPDVAAAVGAALAAAGIQHATDAERGWDHGVFVPLTLINPQADVPVVQVSVLGSQDPHALFAVGRALAPLRDQNIAIVGSGMASMHNFGLLRGASADKIRRAKQGYGAWAQALSDAAKEESVDRRAERFANWRQWPGAYEAHPNGQADHFSPMVVAAGAAGNGKAKSWTDDAWGWEMETFYWDDE